jgi:hypothetical protein
MAAALAEAGLGGTEETAEAEAPAEAAPEAPEAATEATEAVTEGEESAPEE